MIMPVPIREALPAIPEPRRPLRRLLVPLDGSPLAEQALPVAASLALKAHAPIELVGVQPLIGEYLVAAEVAVSGGALEREAAERLDAYLARTAAALQKRAGVKVGHLVLHGQPAAKLAAHARTRKTSLIVMTTHGRGGIARMWLGSVADQLLRESRTPVLLLHPHDAARPHAFTTLVVGLDRSAREEVVLERAIAFAALAPGTRFALAYVVEPPLPVSTEFSAAPAFDPSLVNEAVAQGQAHLETIAARMRNHGLEVSTHALVGASVGRELCELADRLKADLIVVGTHGRSGTRRMLLGSVADKVVRGAARPVLVVPMAGIAKADAQEPKALRRREKVVYAL